MFYLVIFLLFQVDHLLNYQAIGLKGLQKINLHILDLNYELSQEIQHYHNVSHFPNQTLSDLIIHNLTIDAEDDIHHYLEKYLGMIISESEECRIILLRV
jgi:hypothetical protein